ncbi:MAG: DUF3189 family protein [Bacillota bacterium]|nr:DUF3189 family protein [Bacillota bacterium]
MAGNRRVVLHLRPGPAGDLVPLGEDGQGRPGFILRVGRHLPLAARVVSAWAHILAPGRVEVLLPGNRPAPPPPPGVEAVADGTRCVVYHCFGGAHTSVVAGAIHLGKLPERPSWRDVASLPLFDHTPTWERGWPLYLGTDDRGRRVYAMGRGRDSRGTDLVLGALLRVLGLDGRVANHDTLACAGPLTKLGGYTSRRLGLVRPGRTLAALGITRDIPRLLRVVEQARGSPGGTG